MKAGIIILAALHQFHLKCDFYSLDHLRTIIENINPDIICVELTKKDLEENKDQTVKVEYSKCILPLAQEQGYKLIAMEPDEQEYSRVVDKYKSMNKKIASEEPHKIEIFNQYIEVLYDYLFTYWNSPIDVNSSLTDALFEVKHKFQESLFGSTEKECWGEWNTNFLNTILETSKKYKGKKILVTVGVEHVYWLKKHLEGNSDIKLIELSREHYE